MMFSNQLNFVTGTIRALAILSKSQAVVDLMDRL